jgi:hypothetical protein
MAVVVLKERSSDYHACLDGDLTRWECGPRPCDAVGALIVSYARDILGISDEGKAREQILKEVSDNLPPIALPDGFEDVAESFEAQRRSPNFEPSVEQIGLVVLSGRLSSITVFWDNAE